MYGMKKSELRLVPHDPAWKDDFLTEKRRIESAVGDTAVSIEHVGSTSILTLWAKPILDIALLCGVGGVEPVAAALSSIGYQYRGQYDDKVGHHYAVLERGDLRLCQAHIYAEANDGWYTKLLFRDILSRDTELAREYNEYKLALAETVANKTEYAETKTRWVDGFIQKVRARTAESF
jgi:GrpB-like predicted nucleotidyltransferase (UPF0157 family)